MITEKDIRKLHLKYSTGKSAQISFDINWTHSLIVKEIAMQFTKKLKKRGLEVNEDMVKIGALIHDIGVYQIWEAESSNMRNIPYISHGLIGYNILIKEGYSIKHSRFALTHTGLGITKENIKEQKLQLPLNDYIPITLEEELIAFADRFHTKQPSFCTFEEEKRKLEKFDSIKGMKMDLFKKKFGLPNLSPLINKYEKWHLKTNILLNDIIREQNKTQQ